MRREGLILVSALSALSALLLVPGPRARAEPGPSPDVELEDGARAEKRKNAKEPVWISLEDGVGRVRAAYLPALVWYDGREPAAGDQPQGDGAAQGAGGFAELLGRPSLSSSLSRFVLIRLEAEDLSKAYPPLPDGPREPQARGEKPKPQPQAPPAPKPDAKPGARPEGKPPPSVAERLRLPAGKPALLVLDFRERIVERHDVEPPKEERLRASLRAHLKTSVQWVQRARPVEKLLLESRKAFQVGNTRVAVLKVRDLEPARERARLDPVLQDWVAKTIADYRERARKLFAEAESLEKEGDQRKADSTLKYTKAIDAYDKVAKEFPFKDIAQEANVRSGEVLKKMTLTGQNPFGR